ncbi:CotH kinase family protein [Paenibacillus kyungheensis]|uniref:CotH kinase family protein n=1 Tax=Paenibacillus kyungheensis TaxID=1452732 RepID=A0AAX3M4H3_9BACL|nr:CotH kinase family protein [Paenibacillus kyungheensis]WCT56798.1 CotH kinase family protein [Paenibacillus kyungheensis]
MKWILKVVLAGTLCLVAIIPWASTQEAHAGTVTEQSAQDTNVFVEDKVVDVKITLPDSDFQDMLDHASDEEYHSATVDYNGKTITNVGIRTKGNLSLRSVVQMDDSDRYSFKLSFDEYISGQNLYGLDKINLNNNYSDASYMREFLAYEMSEMLGLPTPKHSFVRIYVNGTYKGLYLAVEQVDDQFIETHYEDTTGTLYKGLMTGSGSDLQWIDDDADSYTGLDVKSESQDKDALINMLDKLNHDSKTPYTDYLDVDSILEYLTLNVVTNNTDSYIGGNKQNYYLYEHGGVFSMIPWDYNMAFGGMGGMGGGMGGGGFGGRGGENANTNSDTNTTKATTEPTTNQPQSNTANTKDQQTATTETTTGNTNNATGNGAGTASSTSLMIDEPTSGALAERPLVAKLLAVDEYKQKYHTMIQNVLTHFLANNIFTAKVNALNDMIAADVKSDPTSFYTYEEYQAGVKSLIAWNQTNTANIQGQLDGTIASSGDGSGNGGMGGGMGMGGGQRGQRPEGAPTGGDNDRNGGMMAPPDGVGGGMGGGPGGGFGEPITPTIDTAAQAKYTAISIGILVLAIGIVLWFRRRRV